MDLHHRADRRGGRSSIYAHQSRTTASSAAATRSRTPGRRSTCSSSGGIDLIPNLVETVKGYAAHEKETLDAVIRARNAAIAAPDTPAGQAEAENQLTGALRQLFALSEAYPDLKANQNFLALQEELTATEGRVAYARQFYNDSVLDYNNKLQPFPTVYLRQDAEVRAARVLRGRRGGPHGARRSSSDPLVTSPDACSN